MILLIDFKQKLGFLHKSFWMKLRHRINLISFLRCTIFFFISNVKRQKGSNKKEELFFLRKWFYPIRWTSCWSIVNVLKKGNIHLSPSDFLIKKHVRSCTDRINIFSPITAFIHSLYISFFLSFFPSFLTFKYLCFNMRLSIYPSLLSVYFYCIFLSDIYCNI